MGLRQTLDVDRQVSYSTLVFAELTAVSYTLAYTFTIADIFLQKQPDKYGATYCTKMVNTKTFCEKKNIA